MDCMKIASVALAQGLQGELVVKQLLQDDGLLVEAFPEVTECF